jgi:hypothetical protein
VKKYDRYEVVEPEKKFKPEKQKQDVKNNETVTLKMSAPDFTNQPIPSFGQTNAGQGTIPNDADYLPKQPAVMGNPMVQNTMLRDYFGDQNGQIAFDTFSQMVKQNLHPNQQLGGTEY